MNLVTMFLLVGSIYFVIIAYGVVRTRKKGLPPRLRIATAAIQVAVVPAVLFALLLLNGDEALIATWAHLLALLALAGFFLALCTDIVAKRLL